MNTNSNAFSLADIADIDVSEIAEIRFENLPAGVYDFEVTQAEMDEKDNKDGDNRILIIFTYEVIGVQTILKKPSGDFDQNSLIGRKHTEKLYLVPDQGEQKLVEGIGRARAFIWDMGCPNKGKLGEVVEATTGHRFTAPIIERPNPNDRTSPYAQLKLKKRDAE